MKNTSFRFPRAALVLLVLASTFAVSAHAAPRPTKSNADSPFTPKELRQGYRDGVLLAKPLAAQRTAADAAESREGLRVARKFPRLDDLRVLELSAHDTTEAALERLRASGRYEFVEPDYLRHAQVVPNDPSFGDLWGLANTGQIRGTPGADIKAPEAWDIRREAPNVVVAVIDSGVKLDHTDIAPNLWRNPNPTFGDLHGARFTSGNGTNPTGNPDDDSGHGTHVAGTIGAVGNNGIGIAGVAWRVQIMALKFLTPSGTGASSDGIACINYAIEHGAHIINASYGANGGSPLSQAELAAIARARDAGIIFVAAAGNATANMDVSKHYPASLPLDNIVAVGASTRNDDIAVFSNYGAAVDLFAPGYDTLSLDYENPNGGTSLKSGTSMAAPHVSGALALLKAQYPNDNYRQLVNRLLRGVDVGGKFVGQAQTNGRLNLLKALTASTNRPFNDDFADRPRLSGDNLAIRTNNAGATVEPGEPAHASIAGATTTLWWQWTAAGNTPVSITTNGSAYDTVLAVYTGTNPAALVPVAANDDTGGTASSVVFTTQAGAIYQIAVAGKSGAAGATFLTLNAAPANDHFATPVVLSGVSTRVTATNTLTTREPNEPRILNNPGGTSLWYRWTAPKSARFQVAVHTLDFDPLLAVYTGSSLESLTLVAAGDNTGFDNSQRPSLVTFDAVAGTTYQITLDAKPAAFGASNTGEFTLNLVDSLWQFATGRAAMAGDSVTSPPAVGRDGTIYFGSIDRSVYALNPDGSRKWAFATTGGTAGTGGSIDTASPAIGADGTVYVGNSVGRFYALDPATGTPRWTRDFGNSFSASTSAAIATDGTIYLKVGDGKLYALNPADGSTRWSVDLRAPLTYASPVIAPDGTIYQGSDDKHLYAIAPDGTIRWRFATDAIGEVYTTPALDAAGNIYFGVLNSGKFYSVTPTGQQRWLYTGSFESISSSPALSADGATVYFGSYDRRIHALDTATGAARWTYQLANQVRASSPAIDTNGVVYIGCYDFKVYAVNPDGTLLRTFDTGGVVRSSPAIVGRTLYVGSNDRKLYAFPLEAAAGTGPWPQYRHNARRIGTLLAEPPTFAQTPPPQAALAGASVTLTASATGAAPFAYQWFKDGTPVPGATQPTLTLASVSDAHTGNYAVTVTNSLGSTTSSPIPVAVRGPADPIVTPRLVNLSVRTIAGTGNQTLIVGFFVSASPARPLLIRAIGPTLTQFGVTGALADPRLQLLSGTAVVAENDDWSTSSATADTFNSVGAFALPPASRDSALLRATATGSYTAQITGASGTGIALAELYDTAPAAGSGLVNLSARSQVNTGSDILIAGFSIDGNVPKTLLIRGVGPSLTALGVGGALSDPRLELYRGTVKLDENDNWSGAPALSTTFARVGAFNLASAVSRDAALLVSLVPGSYTAQVSGVNNTTGVALVEVYELP